ncbi:DUF11 domain-containing protein [Dokdonella immobilis]|uniref:Conserved repeat domain-containing protein n=1 Tax=Dokdonella immobilis TaxID=578942 RepID=A0A1I4XF01_9GAMM|nr:DUF11 domain-containing protein [Dokdonella immobilis]SFN24477.1 conserved repeat domain-containing protein [Dokdonella immobilis]
MKCLISLFPLAICAASAIGAEVTVKNDSLIDNSSAIVEAGFVSGEKGASWLTSPCDGNIVAVQVLWLSASGGTGQTLGGSIEIHRAGTYPTPGALAEQINGPLLTDGVINEYRYLDDNNTVPLIVPVTSNETFVVAYVFDAAPPGSGPSLVVDANGIVAGRNAIYADLGGSFFWLSSETFMVPGDWVIRAVVDCQAGGSSADVAAAISTSPLLYTAGAPISHTITISNAGPNAAPSVVVVDAFPGAYTGVTWSCTASGGATCTSGGSGNISQVVSLPNAAQVTYNVSATVADGTSGILSNSVTAVVNAPTSDPNSANNSATANTAPLADRIFADGFEAPP